MQSPAASLEAAREVLHRVAAHVLARRLYQESGRCALRVSPGGISSPMFGPGDECIRIAGDLLVREIGGAASYARISGSSLRNLANLVEADIDAGFPCGADAPDLGDPDGILYLDSSHVETLVGWYQLGWVVLDAVLGRLPESAEPATLQLWPEHFDIGTNVALANGETVNLGCSPGDRYLSEPYLYVGPRSEIRPGDRAYWNVSFGAALTKSEVQASADPIDRGVQFMRTGLDAVSLAAAAE